MAQGEGRKIFRRGRFKRATCVRCILVAFEMECRELPSAMVWTERAVCLIFHGYLSKKHRKAQTETMGKRNQKNKVLIHRINNVAIWESEFKTREVMACPIGIPGASCQAKKVCILAFER